jgi:RimJ/RimL family protein N-acetyltransferase
MNKSQLTINKTDTFIEHDIEIDGVKIGEVELCPERHEISRLVIFEPYQNKGYGTIIVKDLIQQGYTSLWVKSDNKRAIHVYEKCGFVKGVVHMFEMNFKKEIEE